MSWFAAARLLRSQAVNLRNRTYVSPAQLDAARAALTIFSQSSLEAIRAEWNAEAFDRMAEVLERHGRDQSTPAPKGP